MPGAGLLRPTEIWRRALSSPPLTLNGWVRFDLPRTVTALGVSVLTGLVAIHAYLLATQPDLPGYFAVYSAALMSGCVAVAGAMVVGSRPAVSRAAWYLGSCVCTGFLAIYVLTRFLALPRLEALTGRWDIAPGTLAMALAAGFVAVHTTVLSGINVAYPQQRNWRD